MRGIDVTGHEISKRKSVENKGVPGVGTVWTTVPVPGFFAVERTVGTSMECKTRELMIYCN